MIAVLGKLVTTYHASLRDMQDNNNKQESKTSD